MKEVELQSLVLDAVRHVGGAGRKLSNRFLVGVPDLLVKISDCPAVLLEVKQRQGMPKEDRFDLPLTVPQQKTLKDFWLAGMACGAVSFIQGRSIKDLKVGVFALDELVGLRFDVPVLRHYDIGASELTRFQGIVGQLRSAFVGQPKG